MAENPNKEVQNQPQNNILKSSDAQDVEVITQSQPDTNPVVKSRRFEELDLSRSLPLLLLPLVHIYEEFELIEALEEDIVEKYDWILYLCTLMPSVFMLLMGANVRFSRRTTPDFLIKRGCHLLIAGVMLNVYRFIIPSIIGTIFTGETEDFYGEYGTLYFTLTPDIYDFAGLAFILLGFLTKYKISPLAIILIAMLMVTIDTIIPDFSTGITYIDGFLGRFIYMNEDSCFPLLTWFVFPTIGYYVGYYYKNFEKEIQRKYFMIKTFFISFTALVGFCFVLNSYDIDPLLIMTSPANTYITDFTNVVMLTFLAGMWFALFYFIYFKVKNTKICQFFVFISKDILLYYVTQWIIIGWAEYMCTYFVDKTEYMNKVIFWVSVVVTMILSTLNTYFISKNEKVKKIFLKLFFL